MLAALVAACGAGDLGTGPGPVEPPPAGVHHVVITPAEVQLLRGEMAQLTASARAADSTVLNGRAVTWRSLNLAVATVTSTGAVIAVGAGSTVVRATIDGKVAEATVQVNTTNPVPAITAVSPDTIDTGNGVAILSVEGTGFAPGASVLLDGAPRPTTRLGATALQVVLGPADLQQLGVRMVAVQNPAPGGGVSTALGVTIRAGVASVVTSATSLVVPVGQSIAIDARALDASGTVLEGRTISWATSSAATASVNAAGVVSANRVGVAFITAASGGRSAQVRVDVVEPVGYVSVGPTEAAVLVGGNRQLTARTFTTAAIELFGRTVTWSSENPQVATVDEHGTVTGVNKGTVRIRAESEGVIGSVLLEVRQWGPGNVQTLGLRGVVGSMLMPKVGYRYEPVDGGMPLLADLFLTGGTLSLDFGTNRWIRTLTIAQVVPGMGTVGQEQWVEQGSFGYVFGGGILRLTTDGTGEVADLVDAGYGEMVVASVIGTAGPLTYRWVLQ